MYFVSQNGSSLLHYGVKGMKWGVRRYQNKDGTLTLEGKRQRARTTISRQVSNTMKDVQDIADSLSDKERRI